MYYVPGADNPVIRDGEGGASPRGELCEDRLRGGVAEAEGGHDWSRGLPPMIQTIMVVKLIELRTVE